MEGNIHNRKASFIKPPWRGNKGTFHASEIAGIEPMPSESERLDPAFATVARAKALAAVALPGADYRPRQPNWPKQIHQLPLRLRRPCDLVHPPGRANSTFSPSPLNKATLLGQRTRSRGHCTGLGSQEHHLCEGHSHEADTCWDRGASSEGRPWSEL